MDIVFNEASLHDDFIQKKGEDEYIKPFFNLLLHLIKNKSLDNILIDGNFFSDNYIFFNSIRQSSLLNDKERQWLSAIWQKIFSFFEKSEERDASFHIEEKDYLSEGACKAIVLNKKYVLNFATHGHWENEESLIDYSVVSETDIETKKETVKLLTRKEGSSWFLQLGKDEKYKMISSGQDLLDRWNEFFPNLIKCGKVEENLKKDPEKFHIDCIIKQLEILQSFFHNRTENRSCSEELVKMGADVSGETGATRRNKTCEKERTFTLPNGETGVFWLHMKFEGKFNTRLHFLPVPDKLNECYVGYIGRHLHTSSDFA